MPGGTSVPELPPSRNGAVLGSVTAPASRGATRSSSSHVSRPPATPPRPPPPEEEPLPLT